MVKDHFLFKAVNKLSNIKEATIHQRDFSVPDFFRLCTLSVLWYGNRIPLQWRISCLRYWGCRCSPLSYCKEPPQPRSPPAVGVRVTGTHTVSNQYGSAPVQDTRTSYWNPEFPVGPIEAVTVPARTPDFTLHLILLLSPPFHRCRSPGASL